MILVLGFLMVMMAGSAVFFAVLHRTMTHAHREEQRAVCIDLAEGGFEKALAELRAGNGAYSGEEHAPLGAGTFSVAVQPGPGQGAYRVTATGFLRDGAVVLAKAGVAVEVVLAPDGAVRSIQWTEVRSR